MSHSGKTLQLGGRSSGFIGWALHSDHDGLSSLMRTMWFGEEIQFERYRPFLEKLSLGSSLSCLETINAFSINSLR
jgi:hypothetical protein